MKRWVPLLFLAIAWTSPAFAQFTTVTATVTDPNGIPYAGAIMSAILVPASSGGYTLGGTPYSGQVGPVQLDSAGKFSVNFGDVAQITPGSAQWQITIDSAAATIQAPLGTGPQSFTFTSTGTTISGSSIVNLTASLNVLAPKLTTFALASGGIALTGVAGPPFAAPTVTPAVSGSSTWGYTIIARNGTVDIATSAQGTTATGTATLSSINKNVIAWIPVPNATAYDVFVSISPVAIGYLATVTSPSYTDTGTPAVSVPNLLTFNESGYSSIQPGLHVGNMSWADVWTIPNINNYGAALAFDSANTTLVEKTIKPAGSGNLPYANYGFAAGQFIAYGHGTNWSPTALNLIAIGDTDNPTNGINGEYAIAINDIQSPTIGAPWVQGFAGAGINFSPGITKTLIGVYGTAQNFTTPSSIQLMTDFLGEVFLGTGSNNIGIWANYFGSTNDFMGHTNVGKAALTAVYYSADANQSGAGANDWSFYSAGGQNRFAGNHELTNLTAATSGANRSSPIFSLKGQYWTGSATAFDSWTSTNTLGTGANPSSTLNINHTGSSGVAAMAVQGFFSTTATTVSALPAAAAGNAGQQRVVSDSTAVAAEGQTCVGGSTNTALAFSNGTVWKCF